MSSAVSCSIKMNRYRNCWHQDLWPWHQQWSLFSLDLQYTQSTKLTFISHRTLINTDMILLQPTTSLQKSTEIKSNEVASAVVSIDPFLLSSKINLCCNVIAPLWTKDLVFFLNSWNQTGLFYWQRYERCNAEQIGRWYVIPLWLKMTNSNMYAVVFNKINNKPSLSGAAKVYLYLWVSIFRILPVDRDGTNPSATKYSVTHVNAFA